MRVFVAIDAPEGVKRELLALQERLRKTGVRPVWVKPDNMHLTLRFLGDISQEQADSYIAMLEEGYRELLPFKLHVGGVGVFPSERRPSVVWSGVLPEDGPVAYAHTVAESAARAIGLLPEDKVFRPHLTVARIKDFRDTTPLVEYLHYERQFDGGDLPVRSIRVYSSTLTPKGPIYRCLREITL